MPKYLIAYDLKTPGKDYGSLIQALQQQGAKRLLLSAWGVDTTFSAVQVRDWLRQYMDDNDRILVTRLDDWAVYAALTDPNNV